MAKKVETGVVEELKKLLDAGKLVIGEDETLKSLRSGKVRKVFVSSNASEASVLSLERYCALNDIDLVRLDKSSDETGTLCKRPFAVSVIGVLA